MYLDTERPAAVAPEPAAAAGRVASPPRSATAGALADRRDPTRGAVASAAIAVAMIAVALFMWIGVPVLALYLASQVSGPRPAMAPYLVVLVALVAGLLPCMKVLALLQRMHCRASGGLVPAARSGWLKGACDDRHPRPPTMLDKVMTGTVIAGLTAFVVWFVGYS